MPFFSSSSLIWKKISDNKSDNVRLSQLKIHSNSCSWKPNFSESASFHRDKVGLTNFWIYRCVCIVNVMISLKKYLSNFSQSVLINCLRAPLYWSLIKKKSYVIHDVWCVMRDVWCSTLDFCKILTNESRRDQKYLIWLIWVIFQNWSQLAVVCTLHLARPLSLKTNI